MSPDDRIVFVDYVARSEAGQMMRAPVILSNTANELSSLVPWPMDNLTAGPYQPVVTVGDVAFGVCPTLNSTVCRNRVGVGVPVFRMQDAGTFPDPNYYEWLGTYRRSDLSITSRTYELLDGIANMTTFEIEVNQSLQDHILALVKDPYHGPAGDDRLGAVGRY